MSSRTLPRHSTRRLRGAATRRLPWPVYLGLAAVTLTIGYPLFMLVLQSIFPALLKGKFSGFLAPYLEMVRMDGLAQMWSNSIVCGAAATLAAWLLGIPAGWLLARTSVPGKSVLRVSLLIPVMSPPYLMALAYVLLLQPHGLLETWGVSPPGWLRGSFFSFGGIILVMTLTSFGAVALLVESALLGISTRMEDAARCLGSSPWRIFRAITLPLLLPAIMNAGILVFIDAVSNFGIAAILAPRANIPLLPEVIYELLTSWPTNLPLGAALSAVLAVTAMTLVMLNQHLMARQTVTNGRLPALRLIALGRGRTTASWLFFGTLFFFSSILPVAAVLYMSLIKRWQGGKPVLSLENYTAIFRPGSRGIEALSTSLLLSVTAATLTVIIGAVVAYALSRFRGRLVSFLDQLSVLPRVVPNLVVAVAMILAWNVPWVPFPVYGTLGILLLAYVALYQATALRFADAAMQQIPSRLEQAAACLGTPSWRVLLGVVLPMLRPSLFVAWITIVIMCLRDWVASIMLLPPGIQTVGSFIFNQFEQGDFAQAMAMTFCTVVLSTLLLVAANLRFYRRAL
jgi:iron(III) transport system permease protein